MSQQVLEKARVDRLANDFQKAYSDDPHRFQALPGITTNWGPKKLVQLFQFAADPDMTQQDLASALGVDRSGISRKSNSLDWTRFSKELEKLCGMTKEDAIKYEAEKKAAKVIAKEEIGTRQKMINIQAYLATLEHKVIEASKITRIKTEPVHFKPRNKTISSPEHVVLLLSDLHVGLEFSSEEMGGINAYNYEIFKRRMDGLKQGIKSIYEIHREAYRLPVLHIFGLGDMVQGGNLNGEWQCAYNGGINVVEQARLAAEHTADLIRFCSTMFEQINFVGVVGNHGRAGVTKASDKVGANWDNVAYIILKGYFHDNPRVSISYENTWWAHRNVLGKEFMLVHGDYIAGGPAGLLKTNLNNQDLFGARSMAIYGVQKGFNILCLGHFHSHMELETTAGAVIVNGSFVGADVHAAQHMRVGCRPTQTIFGVHPVRGKTWKYCLDLERGEKPIFAPYIPMETASF